MSKNYMPEIAKMLGVKLDENFKVVHPIYGSLGTYYLTSGGITHLGCPVNVNDVLILILTGHFTIENMTELREKGDA